MTAWEEQIALNCFDETKLEHLEAVKAYTEQPVHVPNMHDFDYKEQLDKLIARDTSFLPPTNWREGYYGDGHYSYWLSGLRDKLYLEELMKKYNRSTQDVSAFDFGCATGRVIRHWACDPDYSLVSGCDINAKHIRWVNEFLPANVQSFQSSSVPALPIEHNVFDLVTAFSVFSHIEAFETTWLMEMRRILKPGGLFYVTIQSNYTWQNLDENWPVYQALKNYPGFKVEEMGSKMENDKIIFRWRNDQSYSSNVFLHHDHIKKVWGRYFDVLEVSPKYPGFQDSLLLQKK